MNLYTAADGLFGTHVTWADIEEDMQRELDTVASFGSNKTAKDIGDGNGFMSKIVLIEPDWQHKDKQLPEKFIVKILTQLAMQKLVSDISDQQNVSFDETFSSPEFMAQMEVLQKNCHNAEVTVYTHLVKVPEHKVDIPKIYYMKKFTEWNPVKGYMIMEYFENIKSVHIFENISPEDIKQVIRNKAVIEAQSLDFTPEEKEALGQSPFKTLFAPMFKKEVLGNITSLLRTFDGGKLADRADKLEEIMYELSDLDWADKLADEFGMERVLCHGDLWSMNLLWRKDGDAHKLAAMIDYQTAHFGCAATDLVRLFCACLSGKDRQAYWEELLEEFYSYLKKEVGNRKMPYTIEQLKEAYLQYLPMGAFMIVPMIGSMFEMVIKNADEEHRKKSLVIVMEKAECMLDDIFYYNERNRAIRKSKSVA